MTTGPQNGIGRTPWDLLIEVIQNRKAVLWAAVVAWLLVAGAVVALWTGRASIQLNGISSPQGLRPTSCDGYEISIISPHPGESVAPPFYVEGFSRSKRPLPEGFQLWLFTTLPPSARKDYWPLAPSEVRDGQWRVKVSPGKWNPGDTRHYGVFLVGKDGQSLIRYYKTAMSAPSKPNDEWMPLTETTSDMLPCIAAYEVKLK